MPSSLIATIIFISILHHAPTLTLRTLRTLYTALIHPHSLCGIQKVTCTQLLSSKVALPFSHSYPKAVEGCESASWAELVRPQWL